MSPEFWDLSVLLPEYSDSVKAGDCGETLGRLAPMGNVKLGDMVVEAESRSGYIDAHRPVEVVKVLRNKVIVQLKTV